MRFPMKLFKPLAPFLFPEGSVRTIFWGPCRGMRYRIFPGYGWAPLYGGWEPEAQMIMGKYLRNGYVAYDVGANYGVHSMLMSRLVQSAGRVYGFEPVPPIADALREVIRINQLENVTVVPSALSDRIAVERFYRAHHDGAGHLESAGLHTGEALDVSTTTLDDFVFTQNNRPPDFIKMDIEGGEGRALSGGRGVLEKFRPVILIDLHNPTQDQQVGTILSEARYRAIRTEDGKAADLGKPWPDRDGIWGQVLAWPEERDTTQGVKP